MGYISQKPANSGLRSQYALRMYGWAKKFATVGKKRISLEQLRKLLGLESVKDAKETSSQRLLCQRGRTSAGGRWIPRSRRSPRRRISAAYNQANWPVRHVGRKDLNVLSRRSSSDLASINSFLRSSSAFSPVVLRTGSQLFFLR